MRIGIVGGGVIGCAIARALSARGLDVHLFEARQIGGGATQASAGALVPFVEAHEPGPLQALTVRSLGMFDDFVASVQRESGERIDYARCGSLEVALSAGEAETLKRMTDPPVASGVSWVDGESARRMQPGLPHDLRGGVLAASHGYVGAGALTRALARAAESAGARITLTPVAKVVAEHDRASVVTASGESHAFDRVVLAAGSWMSHLVPDGFALPPVHPVKGQLLRVRCSGVDVRLVLWSSACYVVPQGNGDLLVGATMEDVGFDETPTEAAADQLLDGFRRLLPGSTATLVGHHVGLRPATPDGLPIIGYSASAPSVIYATGHFRNGIILTPLTAHLVANLLLGDGRDPALQSVTPSRFRKKGQPPF